MLLTRSLRRRIVVAAGAALGFVLLYESPIFDAQYFPSAFRRTRAEVAPSPQPDPQDVASPAPGLRLRFRATAYCKGTTTASGAGIQTGIAAADPNLLPVGSVIRVESLGQRYNGIYTILDTGPRVKGRQIDIYMWSCNEALAFGRRTMALQVMRLGWNPRTSTPESVGSEFRRREARIGDEPVASKAPAASRPPEGASDATPPAPTQAPPPASASSHTPPAPQPSRPLIQP